MPRRYEFVCPDCETGYLRLSSEATRCPSLSCRAGYMQLVTMIELAENVGIFTGYPKRTKIEKILDKSS